MNKTLETHLIKLMHHYGPQNWWPADNDIEMMIGAICVQNTSWKNVEKALIGFNRPFLGQDILNISIETLQDIIRPSGFSTRKSETIHALLTWYKHYNFDVNMLQDIDTPSLRNALLRIKGIGNETADCILLYAFNRPVFVVDAYLKKLLKHFNMLHSEKYEVIQKEMMDIFEEDVTLYQELHAVIVESGKQKGASFGVDTLTLVDVPTHVYLDVIHREPMFLRLHQTNGYIGRVSYPDPYTGFVYTIIGQLLSVRAAQTIFTRFITAFPTVSSVNEAPFEAVMQTGLSRNKTHAIKSLCEEVATGRFDFEGIRNLSDQDAIDFLRQLKGIGTWSAIIILIHTYNRLNLTSYDDIALRRSVSRILNEPNLTPLQFNRFMEKFEPYKSVASIFLWKYNKIKD